MSLRKIGQPVRSRARASNFFQRRQSQSPTAQAHSKCRRPAIATGAIAGAMRMRATTRAWKTSYHPVREMRGSGSERQANRDKSSDLRSPRLFGRLGRNPNSISLANQAGLAIQSRPIRVLLAPTSANPSRAAEQSSTHLRIGARRRLHR